MNERALLPTLPVPGFRLDSLGDYLASLGLLRVLARSAWPRVRAAWKEGVMQVVGGPTSMDAMLETVCEIGAKLMWSPYERGWKAAQKSSAKLALYQASTSEQSLEILTAHAVPGVRVSFNRLLGSGGNAGKRDFSKGWNKAVQEIAKAPPDTARAELKCLLRGDPAGWIVEKLNGASWFSDANKLYNSGQRPYREGAISPWAMALACEGLAFFAGSPSRRLGSRARAVGAFPFVARAAAPCSAGEAGHDMAEVWAPVWERPMTLPEIVTMFSRGRAEASGRGASNPGAFAVAVMRRGVDAGVVGFRRFVLARTTSGNTFEPRFDGVFHTQLRDPAAQLHNPATSAMERLLALVNQIRGPLADRPKGKRWRYVGLRGDIERGLLQVAQSPSDSEVACALLDSVVAALDRIDRNKDFRERQIAWEPLPPEWLVTIFGDEAPGAEARLALALASSFPAGRPLALYRFGVELRGRRFVHPPEVPKRWVWRSALPICHVLSEVLHRRVLDWESARDESDPARLGVPARGADVDRWLSRLVDSNLVVQWISRFALFDWRRVPAGVRSIAARNGGAREVSGRLCLFGFLQPLFDLRPVCASSRPAVNLFPPASAARTPAVARRLLGLLRTGDLAAAVHFAASRYTMAGAAVVRNDAPWSSRDVEALAASLLFPILDYERSLLVSRWLRPRRERGGNDDT
ncbi:MAG: type I-U CRISPR-associated protein Csx17 [Bryobacteraceae bacterium]